MFDSLSLLNLLALVIFLLCSAGYHGLYFIHSKKCQTRAIKTRIDIFREKGIEYVLKNNEHIVLVQQLRDLIYVNTFLASSSLIFVGAVMNVLINLDSIEKNIKIMNIDLFEFKILFMVGLLSLSFIFFMSSLRYYRMVSIMVTTPPMIISEYMGIPAHRYLATLLNKGSSFYTLGSRGLLYSLLILLWLVNTPAFILATVLITLLFAKYKDFVPKEGED